MKRLLIDCSSGMSGDMFLGALVSLGCDFSPFENIFQLAGIKLAIHTKPVNRAGGPGQKVRIEWPEEKTPRDFSELGDILMGLELAPAVREKSLAMLERLDSVVTHNIPAGRKHLDGDEAARMLVHIVGAAWGLVELGVVEVYCGPLPWFGGFEESGHGRMALPAPATLELLKGKPVYQSGAQEELVTTTGALLLDTLVDRFGPGEHKPDTVAGVTGELTSAGIFERSGLGYGSKEPDDLNGWASLGLRLHLFNLMPGEEQESPYIFDEVYLITCHIDHLTGEEIGHAINMLGNAGVLDVLWTPGLTKKNRPSGELQVMCMIDMLPKIQDEIFKHTHTLGIRVTRQTRVTLPRKPSAMESPWGTLDAKEYKLLNQTFTKAEYEALAETAARIGIGLPALRVQQERKKN